MASARRWLAVATLLLLLASAGAALWRVYTRVSTLTIAVGPQASEDTKLASAFARALAADGALIRVNLLPTSGPIESAAKLNSGEAQLAVVRADSPASDQTRLVAVLHRDFVVLMAPDRAKVDDFAKLKGRRLGVIGPPGANDALLAMLMQHHGMGRNDLRVLPLPVPDVVPALRTGRVDAVLFTVPALGAVVGEKLAAASRALRLRASFIDIGESDAIAAAHPAYQSEEIPAGAFRGTPAMPPDSVDTLQVATYLVAARNVPDRVTARLARALIDNRQKLLAETRTAQLIEAPDDDKDKLIPVHPGAKEYFEGEEKTLMDQYGDWLFYGPMIIGALGSALLAIWNFLGLRNGTAEPAVFARVRSLVTAARRATTADEVAAVRSQLDELVADILTEGARSRLDANQIAALSIGLGHVREALTGRDM